MFSQLDGLVGKTAALQIQEAIKNRHLSGNSVIGTIVGGAILLFSAGGIFAEIQDSINMIWGLKAKTKRGILKLILNRIISFSLVLSLGFALLVSLVINALIAALKSKLEVQFPGLNVNLTLFIDWALQIVIITYLIAIIFRILPDAKIKWRDVSIGAFVTTILFLLGKILLGYIISRNASIEAYGAAGSIVLILLWVYYSSAILYFGAEFTQVFAKRYGSDIQPNKYATWVETHTVEVETPSVKDKNIVQEKSSYNICLLITLFK